MDPVESYRLQALVDDCDVYAVRDAEGFWTYFSRLIDGRWIVEYEPKIVRRDRSFLVVGPYGVREVLPMEAAQSVGRVVVSVLSESAAIEREAAFLAAHVATLSLPLRALEEAYKDAFGPSERVVYELCDGDTPTGLAGQVEFYETGSVWRMEDGTEVAFEEVHSRLWPFGSSVPPVP
jgi:hypothetical protein